MRTATAIWLTHAWCPCAYAVSSTPQALTHPARLNHFPQKPIPPCTWYRKELQETTASQISFCSLLILKPGFGGRTFAGEGGAIRLSTIHTPRDKFRVKSVFGRNTSTHDFNVFAFLCGRPWFYTPFSHLSRGAADCPDLTSGSPRRYTGHTAGGGSLPPAARISCSLSRISSLDRLKRLNFGRASAVSACRGTRMQ